MRSVLEFFTSSVRRQLLSSFGVILVLFIVFAVFGYLQLQRIQNYSDDISPASNQIAHEHDFALNLSRLEILIERYLTTSGSEQARNNIIIALGEMNTSLQQLREIDGGADPVLVGQLEQRFNQLEREINQLLEFNLQILTPGELSEFSVGIYAQVAATRDIYEQTLDQTLQSLDDVDDNQQNFITTLVMLFIGLGIVSFALILVFPMLIARRITTPLSIITDTAERLSAGDLSAKVPEFRRKDEVSRLALAINQMSSRLNEMIVSLEARVAARTRDMEVAAQVSEQISSILDVDQLLLQVTELVKANFNLYHAHIYLKDETGDQLELAAGAGEAGRLMKTRGHRISASTERSLVARAARDNNPVIVDNVAKETGFLPNPMLPLTLSEAAFPLAVGERVLGVLDVQSEIEARFDRDLLSVLSTLSGQIAVTLDNARLFSSVERASRRERTLGVIVEAMQQATNMDELLQVAARELGRALRVPHTAIMLQLPHEQPVPTTAFEPPTVDLQAVADRG
ncbi:MAG: GAF domain-containing protein [Chloroflexi bacterium]|nr:GAF domain-containing protein [Chloroflexota bacterium]